MDKLFHYFMSTIRSFRKNKLSYTLATLGLSLAFSLSFISGSIIWQTYSSDNHWQKADRIYQLSLRDESNDTLYEPWMPIGLANDLRTLSPNIDSVISISNDFGDRVAGGKRYETLGTVVSKNFPYIFDLDILYGDIADTFSRPNIIAISNQKALEYYGIANPVGNFFELHSRNDAKPEIYTVGAVYKEPPKDSIWHGHAFLITPNPTYDATAFKKAYLLLKPEIDIDALETEIHRLAADKYPVNEDAQGAFYKLEPVKGLQANKLSGKYANTSLLGLILASALMLVIAIINYSLILIALLSQKKQNIGLRKILGASKRQIRHQYISEALVLISIAYFLSLVFAELFAAPIAGFTGENYSLNLLENIPHVITGWFITLCIGLATALYPAFILNRINAATVVRTTQRGITIGNSKLYSFLMSTQSLFGMGLGFAACVIYAQAIYQSNIDKGIAVDELMYVTVDIKTHPNYPSTKPLRQELGKLDGIHSVGNTSYSLPFKNPLGERIYEHPVSGIPTHIRYTSYGEDFFKSHGIDVIAGQIPAHLSDTGVNNQIARAEYLIINESLAKLIGFKTPTDALEQCIYPITEGKRGRCQLIKAVVRDFHFSARKTPIEPTAFQPVIGYVNRIIIQFDKNADMQSLLPKVQERWNKHFPERVFEYEFVIDLINDQFRGLRGMGVMFLIVSSITLCLAVAGLLAMAKFTVDKRKHEIAIRRVVGAATVDIVSLMITQLGKPILFGTIIGMPAGWYASQLWLNNHTIRIDIEPVYALIFVLSIVAVFLTTVTAEILRAARIHPAHTLTNE